MDPRIAPEGATPMSLDDIEIPIDRIVAKNKSGRLAARLASLDKNQDGTINAEELVNLIRSDIDQRQKAKNWLRVSIVLGILMAILLAANAGLTYAVVVLSKDTEVSNNVLVSKDSGKPLGTSKAMETHSSGASFLTNITPEQALSVSALVLPCQRPECAGSANSTEIIRVASVTIITPGELTTVQATDGRVIVAQSQGMMVFDNFTEAAEYLANPTAGPSSRRRLLESSTGDITIYSDTSTTSPDREADPPDPDKDTKPVEIDENTLKRILENPNSKQEAMGQARVIGQLSDDHKLKLFDFYKEKYRKVYEKEQEAEARSAFLESLDRVYAYGMNEEIGMWLDLNKFADMTDKKFEAIYQAPIPMPVLREETDCMKVEPTKETSVNWVTKGMVTKVRDQKQCGTCSYFATLAYLESKAIMKYPNALDRNLDLAEQPVIKCVKNAQGVDGGCHVSNDAGTIMTWLKNNRTIIHEEKHYPYAGGQAWCSAKQPISPLCVVKEVQGYPQKVCGELQTKIDGILSKTPYMYVSRSSEVGYLPELCPEALLSHLAKEPLVVTVQTQFSWKLYGGGIMDVDECPDTSFANHQLLAVGFDISSPDPAEHYVLLKNSWGGTQDATGLPWGYAVDGDRGYVKLRLYQDNSGSTCGMLRQHLTYLTGIGPIITPCYPSNDLYIPLLNIESLIKTGGCTASTFPGGFQAENDYACYFTWECKSGLCRDGFCKDKVPSGEKCYLSANSFCQSGSCVNGYCA